VKPALSPRLSRRSPPARHWLRFAVALVCAIALGAPLTAGADSEAQTTLSPGLLDAAQAEPDAAFRVIVEGASGTAAVSEEVRGVASGDEADLRSLLTVPAVAGSLTGSQIVALAEGSEPLVITRDSPVVATDESRPDEPTAPGMSDEPTVAGDAEPGHWLTATPGTWSGSGMPGYSFQWERCGSNQRSAAMLAGSPAGHWVAGDREGDMQVAGPGSGTFSSAFTFEAWVEPGEARTGRTLISRWVEPPEGFTDTWEQAGGIRLYLDENGNYALAAGSYSATHVRTSVGPVAEREHLAGTWDGSSLRLYRDGAEIGSEELFGPLADPPVDLVVGSEVREAAVYGRALTPSEVSGHYAGCVAIPGAAEEAHRVAAADLGLSLRVVVTGADEGETRVTASGLTQSVTARPPLAVSPPSIVGTAEDGQTLNAANGTWDGTEPMEFAHQWQRCDSRGEDCGDIAGASGPSYTVGPGDVGATIRLTVTASGLGGDLLALSEASEPVVATPEPQPRFKQHWPYVAGVAPLLSSFEGQALDPPTIAIVDSGIDSGRADFGGRVIDEVNLSTRQGNQPGDGYGHGTAVASVAAGEAEGYVGAAPDARLVAVEALDDDGVAYLSDVIAAADWIYLNRERLNIRVANFSLHGTTVASLASDPLDRAVERLWLSGVVVVAAAGNYAVNGEESFVPFAPGNDPFVLTVGATDTRGSFTPRDDVAAPWSAWGYTRDGFAKPELGAPGRYIASAVSADTTLSRTRPERIVEPGYLQLSGTSLAAPVVAGTAANLLAAHPEWTPDQVKGALMLTAEPLARARPRSTGVGALNAASAAAAVDPPNPNLALQRFLVPDPSGGTTPVFDVAGWTTVAQSDPAWASVAWGSVAWGSAAWSSVAWGSVAWGSVAWGSVAWGSVAWGSNSEDDLRQEGGYWVRRD
jgi:serine protease AprX